MSYQTQPGTLPHRVVEYLRRLGPGAKVATVVLCEELGLEGHQVGSFSAWMAPARNGGAVVAEPQPGSRNLFWSLGTGAALPDQREEEPPAEDAPKVAQRAAASPAPRAAPTEKPKAVKPKAERPRREESQEREIPVAASLPFNACRYIDGSVIVIGMMVRDDGAVIFSPQQAKHLWTLGAAA